MNTELANRVAALPDSPDWLGYAPATDDDLADLERRLGLLLPPSYESFLRTTNGWRRITPFIGRIRPAAEVNWFRIENEHWSDVYAEGGSKAPDQEYYAYDHEGSGQAHRAAHMKHLIQISDVDDGVLLLNPQAVTPDGEWEAWFFASWVPGAMRYPSFAHLMLREYASFARLQGVDISDPPLPTLDTPAPDVPRVPAKRVRTTPARAPSIESLIEGMDDPDDKRRARAVRTFFGKGKMRNRAPRRPELVPRLVALFYRSKDPAVRCACVSGLTEYAEDGDAPAPLFDALSDPNPSVFLQGVFALHYFPDPRALEPLCRFIESRANVLYNENAISYLGRMGDDRAVPTLVGVLLDTDNKFDQSFGSAGGALGRCGPRGVDALINALDHADPRVRHAAVVGLDTSGDPRSPAHLDRMESDPDSRVRERARIRMGKPDW
jgi:hypothetical protein